MPYEERASAIKQVFVVSQVHHNTSKQKKIAVVLMIYNIKCSRSKDPTAYHEKYNGKNLYDHLYHPFPACLFSTATLQTLDCLHSTITVFWVGGREIVVLG